MKFRPPPIFAATLAVFIPVQALACTLPGNAAAVRAEVVSLVNAERQRAGLPGLGAEAKLQRAAQDHACDNAGRRQMSHTGGDGANLRTRIQRVGYPFRAANENVGLGFANAANAVRWWMKSPGHKANILARNTRDIGIGVALAADQRLHWVMVSGAPK